MRYIENIKVSQFVFYKSSILSNFSFLLQNYLMETKLRIILFYLYIYLCVHIYKLTLALIVAYNKREHLFGCRF